MQHACPTLLRPAHPTEAAVLAGLSRQLIEAGLGWRYTPQRMAAFINDAQTMVLVAHDATALQGFAVMQFGAERAHLSLLCVRPAQQRRHIGQRLMHWLIESAQVAGMELIGLELRADNAPALAFYQRLGFTETQFVPAYYNAHLAARRMVLRLRAVAP